MLAGMVQWVSVGAMVAITPYGAGSASRVIKRLLVESIVDPNEERVPESPGKRRNQAFEVRRSFSDVSVRVVGREIRRSGAG